jgi:cytochrome P450 family 4
MTDQKRRQNNAIKVMHDFTINIIQSRRKAISATNVTPTELLEQAEFGIKKKMALLDVLLHSKIDDQPLTDEEIQEEVDTFMFEGHDTTTGAISFTTYILSKHPEIQKKLFEEIQAVAGPDSEAPLSHR